MKSNIFKKIALCCASAIIACSVGAFAGCNPETNHPEVRITYEFNGENYAVEYKLYRNMYPHTVRRFVELSENGFYDNMIIHNYQTNDWFTGGYTYNEADYSANVDNAGQMSDYFDTFSKEEAYNELFTAGKLSASVYSNVRYDDNGKTYVVAEDALPTVMGEFKNNIQQEIEKGALTADYGSLKMFYYPKESKQKIFVTPTNDQIILADYDNNCATSVFAVQTGLSSTYSEANYSVFASLKTTDVFDDLVAAVKAYIDDNYSGTASNFYTANVEARVDNYDNFSNKPVNDKGTSVTFNVPKQPIKVVSVKVIKY
jgi:cyclophilin family peptidyl-prolyl cis-trans isomerase